MSSLRKEIDAAITAATEQVTVTVIRNHLGNDALKQLKAIVKSRPEIGDLTIDRLLANGAHQSNGKSKTAKGVNGSKRKFGKVDLRDDDVRGRFDAKVLMEVTRINRTEEEGAEINDIHAAVGGEIHQIRGAISRLKKSRKIKSKGTGRGCRYLTR